MTQPQSGRIQVDPAALRVGSSTVGALPVVNAVLARLGFDELVASYLPEPDPRCRITSTKAIGVLVRNLALGRQPLYGLSAWAGGCDAALLGLCDGEARLLNDDRRGRALDELFSSDRASLLTALSLAAIRRFGIEVTELHYDSTSITLYAYRQATDTPRAGVRPPVPERGFSEDHRGDLPQAVLGTAVTKEGIPVRVWSFPGDDVGPGDHPQGEGRPRGLGPAPGHLVSGPWLQLGGELALPPARRWPLHRRRAPALELERGQSGARSCRSLPRGDGEPAGERGPRRHRALRHLPQPRARTARRDGHARIVTRLEARIKKLDRLARDKRLELYGALSTKSGLKRFLRLTADAKLRIDKAAIRSEAHFDGTFFPRSSDEDLSAEEIATGDKVLYEAERGR